MKYWVNKISKLQPLLAPNEIYFHQADCASPTYDTQSHFLTTSSLINECYSRLPEYDSLTCVLKSGYWRYTNLFYSTWNLQHDKLTVYLYHVTLPGVCSISKLCWHHPSMNDQRKDFWFLGVNSLISINLITTYRRRFLKQNNTQKSCNTISCLHFIIVFNAISHVHSKFIKKRAMLNLTLTSYT